MNFDYQMIVGDQFHKLARDLGLSFSRLDDLPLIAHAFYNSEGSAGAEAGIDGAMYLGWMAVDSACTPKMSCQTLKILDAQYICMRYGLDTDPSDVPSLIKRAEQAWAPVADLISSGIAEYCSESGLDLSSLNLEELFKVLVNRFDMVDMEPGFQELCFMGNIYEKFEAALFLMKHAIEEGELPVYMARSTRRMLMHMWEEDHTQRTCSDPTEHDLMRLISEGHMAKETEMALQKARM